MTAAFFLTPKPLETISTASDLKLRLDWGEPALTIIDVRSRHLFNENRILGAISMPMDELVARASASLESERDIYVYGETDEMTADAVAKLHEAGYENVAELKGGLTDWQATGGAIEGTVAATA
ncbi:MAG: rhodanese-like domain-containing protein [Cyanobacteria bacterium P01_H01_bin.21]